MPQTLANTKGRSDRHLHVTQGETPLRSGGITSPKRLHGQRPLPRPPRESFQKDVGLSFQMQFLLDKVVGTTCLLPHDLTPHRKEGVKSSPTIKK